MTNNKLVFGIGKILVLMTTVFLTVPSKVAIAQQQDEEMNKMQMSKEMMQNMIEEEISKKIILKFTDEVKKEIPMFVDIVDKIPSMSLEEAVKNLFAVKDIEKLLTIHAEYLIEGKTMGSNQTTMMK